MEETYLIALQYDETKLVTSRNEEIVLDISDLNGASRWSDWNLNVKVLKRETDIVQLQSHHIRNLMLIELS